MTVAFPPLISGATMSYRHTKPVTILCFIASFPKAHILEPRMGALEMLNLRHCPPLKITHSVAAYFKVAISITKRYFTSPLTSRS